MGHGIWPGEDGMGGDSEGGTWAGNTELEKLRRTANAWGMGNGLRLRLIWNMHMGDGRRGIESGLGKGEGGRKMGGRRMEEGGRGRKEEDGGRKEEGRRRRKKEGGRMKDEGRWEDGRWNEARRRKKARQRTEDKIQNTEGRRRKKTVRQYKCRQKTEGGVFIICYIESKNPNGMECRHRRQKPEDRRLPPGGFIPSLAIKL